jgi:hypothetical protein
VRTFLELSKPEIIISPFFSLCSWSRLCKEYVCERERERCDDAVNTASGYCLDDRGLCVQAPIISRMFNPPGLPDRLWG